MPIDAFILGPMLNPYEDMMKDVESRGLSNDHVDEMKRLFDRMKSLGQEHSDISAFTGICMQEDLFSKISQEYSNALQVSTAGDDGDDPVSNYDDGALLRQSIQALEGAIQRIRESQEEALRMADHDPKANLKAESEFASRYAKEHGLDLSATDIERSQNEEIDKTLAERPNAYNNVAEVAALDNSDDLIEPIQNLIDLGKQEGMTFPRFLRLQIEQGLDKAMEGAVTTRKGMEYSLSWAKAGMNSPYHIEKADKHLRIFDDLSSKQVFGVPNATELKWALNACDYEFDQPIAVWENITDRWTTVLRNIDTWALAHCSFAEWVDPWKMLPADKKRPAIEADKATLPGIVQEKLRLLQKYHGLSFHEIFTHPTFQWAVDHHFVEYSKAYVDFLKSEVFPQCKPHQTLSSDLIQRKEAFHNEKKEANPKGHFPAVRTQEHYDQKFGEGRYVSKFGAIEPVESNAAPW